MLIYQADLRSIGGSKVAFILGNEQTFSGVYILFFLYLDLHGNVSYRQVPQPGL